MSSANLGAAILEFFICGEDGVIGVSDDFDEVRLHIFIMLVVDEISCSAMVESMKDPIV